METIKKKSIHTLALRHASTCCGVSPSSSSSSSSFVACGMLVHACKCHIVKGSGPRQRRREENGFKFHSVTCYTNSIASRIHVNTTKFCNITCTLVAIGVVLWSLECMLDRWVLWWGSEDKYLRETRLKRDWALSSHFINYSTLSLHSITMNTIEKTCVLC